MAAVTEKLTVVDIVRGCSVWLRLVVEEKGCGGRGVEKKKNKEKEEKKNEPEQARSPDFNCG